jgi:NADH-quinone oxidoreductase subunit J
VVEGIVLAAAAVAAAASLVVVLKTDVLHAALALIVVLLSLAAIYAGLGAYFIAAVQVAVYAGAVMVLFLFAIMVLESRREPPSGLPSFRLHRLAAGVAGAALLAALAVAGRQALDVGAARLHGSPPGVRVLAHVLFGRYLLPFELVGVLLTVALVAVLFLARRREPGP